MYCNFTGQSLIKCDASEQKRQALGAEIDESGKGGGAAAAGGIGGGAEGLGADADAGKSTDLKSKTNLAVANTSPIA